MLSRAFCAVLTLAAGVAQAQENKAVPVHLSAQCSEDTVGSRIAFKLREGIRRSTSMRIVESYNDSIVQLSLVCIDPGSSSGTVSRYSYAITFLNHKGYYDYHLTHGVGFCGSSRVDECAEGLVAAADQAIVDLKSKVAEGAFTPFDDQ